jgi:flagellar M-ring protein FliF
MGGIKRLTVGVVVNYRRSVDPKTGKVTVKPLTAAEVAQINELVKQAMGYNQARGDTMNVANAPFDGVDKPAENARLVEGPGQPAAGQGHRPNTCFIALVCLPLVPHPAPAAAPGDEEVRRRRSRCRPSRNRKSRKRRTGRRTHEEIALLGPTRRGRREAARSQLQAQPGAGQEMAQNDPRIVANVIKAWVGAK